MLTIVRFILNTAMIVSAVTLAASSKVFKIQKDPIKVTAGYLKRFGGMMRYTLDYSARGFYIAVPNHQYFTCTFYDFKGNPIKHYDAKWAPFNQKSEEGDSFISMMVNMVRGSKQMEVSLKDENVPDDAEMFIFKEVWLCTPGLVCLLLALILFVLVAVLKPAKKDDGQTGESDVQVIQSNGETNEPLLGDQMPRCFGATMSMCGRKPFLLESFLLVLRLSEKTVYYIMWMINIFFHNFDVVSDVLYLATVPVYATWIFVFMIITIIVPVLIILLGVHRNLAGLNRNAVNYSRDGPDLSNSGCNVENLKMSLKYFTGTKEFFIFHYMSDEDKKRAIKKHMMLYGAATNGLLFIFEDGTQFALQVINSLLIGKSWTLIQVISPLLSMKGILAKMDAFKATKKTVHGTGFPAPVIAMLCCFLPLLIVIMTVFLVYTDTRPDWVKVLPTYRSGLEEYPEINPK